ncbi:class I SAM-dependent methyltransferase [Crossiella sp. CA-258035]|uniref:class I SAM-dependent methyltransferase n=1 Tax=Crossiella sp. CA-258035 TaxID=2981138 RepID=UPI0024BC3A52|nr:class I SAM-dependent methyltransferase [Crossiella sp. CA-258035]WHT15798.1 class I SAM-dependent methyltransferase [Crossiella sp. CA-258035]
MRGAGDRAIIGGVSREKIDYREVRETNLATLYGRAVHSAEPEPILRDEVAEELVARIDYDFRRMRIDRASAAAVALRARQFDEWAATFLRRHPDAMVLHLACGLDSRYLRLRPPATVDWFDVDFPDVVALRRRLFPPEPSGYHLLGASVTDPDWLEQIPADRPGLMITEGLTMYLTEAEVLPLLRRVTGHFPAGELQFDAFNRLGARAGNHTPLLRKTGARFQWGLDQARDLERQVPGARLAEERSPIQLPGLHRLPRLYRVAAHAADRVGPLRRLYRLLRYRF